AVAPPRLLIQIEPRSAVFFRNLLDLMRPGRESLELSSAPGEFWPDVFVVRRPAWRRFAESVVYHLVIVSTIIGLSHFWPQPAIVVSKAKFNSADVIRYEPSDYLPPINTGTRKVPRAQKGEPEHARQEIISVPPESDNRTQTIVAPPKLKLNQDVPLPNIVAASSLSVPVPAAVSAPLMADLKMAALQVVVAPPQTLDSINSKQNLRIAPGDVVAPQPTLTDSSVGNFGDLNMAHAQVVAPAPKLT